MEDIQTLSRIINQTNVKINVIAIDFMESYDEENNKVDGISSLNSFQQTNTKFLLKLKELCPENIRILPASIAIELYKEFKKKETNRVALYRGDFTICPDFNIEVATYTESRQDKLITFKKFNSKG